MVLNAALQTIQQIGEVKELFVNCDDVFDNTDFWSNQQHLQMLYHQLLIMDLELALDKKMEQELWTSCFRNLISTLQGIVRNRANSRRSDAQIILSWFLDTAFGFYLNLLHEICIVFDLELPYRRKNNEKHLIYNPNGNTSSNSVLKKPKQSSCIYICEYCLVHLGDIARYRSQRKQAENFYRQANLLSPTNGQPYNQLALLEVTRGNKLGTVYYYVRSIAVKNPFSVAVTNLNNTLQSVMGDMNSSVDNNTRFTSNDFITAFLQIHHYLNTSTNLKEAAKLIKILNEKLAALIATQSFSAFKLIQFFVINLYTLNYATDGLSDPGLTNEEIRVKKLVLEILIGALSAYLLPVHTLDMSHQDFFGYQALPAVKLTLEWIRLNPKILNTSVFDRYMQIWPSLCKLLNSLWKLGVDDFSKSADLKVYEKVPLPEDRDLYGYMPLNSIFDHLKCDKFEKDVVLMNKIRAYRLVVLGEWIANQTDSTKSFITYKRQGKDIEFNAEVKPGDQAWSLLNDVESLKLLHDGEELLGRKKIGSTIKMTNASENHSINPSSKARLNIAVEAILKKSDQNQVPKKRLEIKHLDYAKPNSEQYRDTKIPSWNLNDTAWWPDAFNGGSTSNGSTLSSQFDELLDVSKDFFENGYSSSPPVKGNDVMLSEDNLIRFNNGIGNNDKWINKEISQPKSNSESLKSDGDGSYSLFNSNWALDFSSITKLNCSNSPLVSNGASNVGAANVSIGGTSTALARLIEQQKQLRSNET